MSRASFYLLANPDAGTYLQTACKLAEKAVASGQPLFIQTRDESQARELDEWLWSYRPESFLPHHRLGDGPFIDAPVLLGGNPPPGRQGICLNVSNAAIAGLAGFQRVLELVGPEADARQSARERWRSYQQQGFSLDKHDL